MLPLSADVVRLFTPLAHAHAIVTVGNTMRRDDGAGPYIAAALQKSACVRVVDVGMRPVDAIHAMAALAPQQVFFIDAADFGALPGTICCIDEERVSCLSMSTHGISLRVIGNIIHDDTRASVAYIGIQIGDASLGEGLTVPVQKSCDAFIAFLHTVTGARNE